MHARRYIFCNFRYAARGTRSRDEKVRKVEKDFTRLPRSFLFLETSATPAAKFSPKKLASNGAEKFPSARCKGGKPSVYVKSLKIILRKNSREIHAKFNPRFLAGLRNDSKSCTILLRSFFTKRIIYRSEMKISNE